MITAIVLFVIAALFGAHILSHILKNKETPKMSVYLHGLFAVVGFIIVVISALNREDDSTLDTSAILFTVTALGGIVLFYIDNIKKKMPPKALAVLHPLLAVISLVTLIIYVAGQ